MTAKQKSLLVQLGQWAAALLSIAALLGGGWQFFAQPRLDQYFATSFAVAIGGEFERLEEIGEQLDGLPVHVDRLERQIETLTIRLDRFEQGHVGTREAPLRFAASGHEITDGAIGGTVKLTWKVLKLHDCGAPRIDAFFQNGVDTVHRFRDISILSADGLGINLRVEPSLVQSISYTARIPAGDSVTPGPGFGWVDLEYPDCPFAPHVTSPHVTFQILEPPVR